MKTTALTAMMMMATGAAAYAVHVKSPKQVVVVCTPEVSDSDFETGKVKAALMFSSIGVTLDWRSAHNCPAGGIQVSLSTNTPVSLKPRALAYALPYEGTHIVIFQDRVSRSGAPSLPALFGHVLAHEITHILEGVSRHSETGVMKAFWGPFDYSRMAVAPLVFAPEDVQLIHQGLEGREKSLAANSKMNQDRNTEAAVSAK